MKSFKAKGKRITTLNVAGVEELEPLRLPEEQVAEEGASADSEDDDLDPDAGKSQQDVADELTGQMHLFE